MAALKLVVDSLDGVDEAVKGLYAEDNGKYRLQVDGIEDTSALKGALQKERKAREDREKQVKAWERLNRTPEEITALLDERDKTITSEAEKKGEWDKLRAQMNEKHDARVKELEGKISSKDAAVSRYLIDAQAQAAIASAGGNSTLLLPHVRSQMKVIEEGGEFNVRIVDAKGDPRVNAKGDPLGIAELLAEMKANTEFGGAFVGSGHSGSGTQPVNGGGGSPQHKRRSQFSKQERIAFVEKNGSAAWFSLPG